MAIPSLTDDVEIISKLGTNPGTDNGLSEEQLKAKFDEAAVIIKNFINNTLIPNVNKIIDLDVLIDKTLSKSGHAADAQKTGEEIKNAKTAAGKALTAAVSKTNATITLSANGWAKKEQTVNVPGVTTDEDCDVLITPGNVGYLSYLDCVVRGKEQGDGTVTFICEDVPEEDVSANIMILSKGVKS